MDYICYCCSQFIHLSQLKISLNNHFVIMTNFETNILRCCDLNIYGCYTATLNFCYNYLTYISKSKKPEFDISNKMSKLYCLHYSRLLESFSFVEKAVIVGMHLVIIILKLRLNNNFNLGSYKCSAKFTRPIVT